MTATERFSVIISLLGLVFLVMSAILGLVVKASMTWGRSSQQLAAVVKDLGEIKDDFATKIADVINSKNAEHGEIKERLTFLERRELTQRRKEDEP